MIILHLTARCIIINLCTYDVLNVHVASVLILEICQMLLKYIIGRPTTGVARGREYIMRGAWPHLRSDQSHFSVNLRHCTIHPHCMLLSRGRNY